jgi:hypothetical protein
MVWFLLLSVVNGQPILTPYTDQAKACTAMVQMQGARVYQVQETRNGPEITEGSCLPVVQFKAKEK